MPNIRSLDGGLTFVFAGTVADEEATKSIQTVQKIVVHDQAGAADDADAHVQIDPNNIDGPLVVRFDASEGQRGFTVEDKDADEDVFVIESNSDVKCGDLFTGHITIIEVSKIWLF